MKDLNNKIAVVTGGASGIGRALALELAAEGCDLALSDINYDGLLETKKMLEDTNARVFIKKVDVSSLDEQKEFTKDVISEFGFVDIVINNAGFSICDRVDDIAYEDFERVMNINFWGVVYGTRCFLPYLKQRKEASLVNVSSINGVVTLYYNGAYSISKAASRFFNENLWMELYGTSVRVTSVLPGTVSTNIINNSKIVKLPTKGYTRENLSERFANTGITPKAAALSIIRAIKKKKRQHIFGFDAWFMYIIHKICPVFLVRMVGVVGRNMNHKIAKQIF